MGIQSRAQKLKPWLFIKNTKKKDPREPENVGKFMEMGGSRAMP